MSKLHVFPYSMRRGTKASLMPQVKDHIKSASLYSRVSETGKYVYRLEAYDPQILSAELNTKNSNILGFEFDIAGGVLILDVLDPLSKTTPKVQNAKSAFSAI